MSKLQSKQEEYAKNQRADIIYRVITNKPRTPRTPSVQKEKSITDNPKIKLSINDYNRICEDKDDTHIQNTAILLNISVSKLNAICKNTDSFREYIDSLPITKKEKDKAKSSPIKDLSPKLLKGMNAKTITLLDIPDHLLERIIHDDLKPLLKYNLREWIPRHKIYWGFFSLNPNAIDFLQGNKKKIDYSQLSKNTNPKALELIKEEIMVNPNNPDIDWRALSANPEAIDILDANRIKIKWYNFCFNTSPRAIQILIENQLEKDNGNDDIYWDNLCLNTSDEAIDFLKLPENYRYIEWDILSVNTNPKAIALLIKKESEEFDLEDREFNRLEDKEKISWKRLSGNPNAISLLERKWEEEKELLKNDIKQYNILKKKYYIIDWDILSENPNAFDLLRDKIEKEKIPKKKFDRLDDIEKINWAKLSASAEPKIIQLLEENPTKIIWYSLSANPKAIKLLEENPTKINWSQLSSNSKAIKLLKKELKKKPENIVWYELSANPEAIEILDKNKDKIIWSKISENPNAGELLKDRVEYEDKLPQKKYNQLTNYSKLNWIALSKNPSIFKLS